MELENDTKSSITVASTREPGKIFKFCPRCRSPNLLKFDGEVFCNYCSWDSVLLQVECKDAAFFNKRKEQRPS